MDFIAENLILPIIRNPLSFGSVIKELIILLGVIVVLWVGRYFLKKAWKYLERRNELLEKIRYSLIQATAHLGKEEDLSHAFNGYKSERSSEINTLYKKLFRFDLLFLKTNHYLREFDSTNNFNQAKEITEKFLIDLNRRF